MNQYKAQEQRQIYCKAYLWIEELAAAIGMFFLCGVRKSIFFYISYFLLLILLTEGAFN